jgi:hypothetical protein
MSNFKPPTDGERAYLNQIPMTRVLLNEDDEAVHPMRFSADSDVIRQIECVWVRNDGWSIAAALTLKIQARNLWHDDWVGVWNRASDGIFTYDDLTQTHTRLASRIDFCGHCGNGKPCDCGIETA